MVQALRTLHESAPEGLGTNVLAALGMADGYAEVEGPIDRLYVAWGPEGVIAVERIGDPMGFETEVQMRTGRPIARLERLPAELERKVQRQLAGDRQKDLPVDLGGLTGFERSVLTKTMEIPYGEVRPYAWVAREIGRPRAVRAVGSALAENPIPFVIPCHRVVRTDGHIGEYGAGGPEAKRAVLATEGVDPDELEQLASKGIRYIGSDTTGVFCYPSCRHARRVTPRHRVTFRSGEHARASGFRACKVCRPLEGAVFAA
jgi:O-6-methylguanine DNA methyltransferase